MDFEPYESANLIDSIFNKMAESHPMNLENIREWHIFIRTVSSSLDLLKENLNKVKGKTVFETEYSKFSDNLKDKKVG